MAFAGNDLVNFIGVPLAGYSSFQDYSANAGGDAAGYMMDSLNGPAHTPVLFLIAAGLIMVISLATSKKAQYQYGLCIVRTGSEWREKMVRQEV